MASTFTWLDYSEHERRKMLDAIESFGEKTTRDELGLGSVRDAFADLLFPGTSTIQTRAKYFLFVPWIYLNLERKRTPSTKVVIRARKLEIELAREFGNGQAVVSPVPCARWSKVTYHRVEPVEPGGIPNYEIPYGDSGLKVKTAGVNPAASVPKWRCPTRLWATGEWTSAAVARHFAFP
jgi:hypothetical protein